MDHHKGGAADPNRSRAEAERLLGIAEKLLQTRDLTGSREFAVLAQETEPLLEGSDQILAITDVLLASERRVNNHHHQDWYAILQTDRRSISSDPDLLKKNYRRLALLLHPDKNKYPLSDAAFKLVADAWAVLSDPTKRTPYDHELSLFSRVDLQPQQQRQFDANAHHNQQHHHQQNQDKDKLPVRRSPRGGGVPNAQPQATFGGGGGGSRVPSFWTACPYCYVLYEYPRVYEDCCIRCQNCERAFHAAQIPSLPPMVPGKEAYYCCWGFFPLGFSLSTKKVGPNDNHHANANGNANANANANTNNSNNNAGGLPNWMPGMFNPPVAAAAAQPQGVAGVNVNMNMNAPGGGGASAGLANNRNASTGFTIPPPTRMGVPGPRKRGRPRKNPLPV